jgi:hypothetical protein
MNLPRAVIVAVLALCALGLAQDRAYNPACAEVLRFTPDAFTDRFTERNKDGSEAALDEAGITWANCKYDANLARLKNYPALRARLVQLYKLQGEFFRQETELAYASAGGGTMYPHGLARFQPSLQQHLERLVNLTTTRAGAAQSVSISARYAKAKRALEARINWVQTPRPFTDYQTAADVAARKREWLENAKIYRATYQSILKLIGPRVDATSTEILEFLARGLWTEELR